MPTFTIPTRRAFSVESFCEAYALRRSKAYQLIAEGKLVARKIGRKTVIDVDSAEAWYANLPHADIRPRVDVKP